jgi:hypothetical protein
MNAENTIQILASAASEGDTTAALAFTDAVAEEGKAGFCGYHPEMSEVRPVAHMEARLSHSGRHWFIDTPLELKGRGITSMGKFHGYPGSHKNGWNSYRATEAAFEKLQAQYRIASEMLL